MFSTAFLTVYHKLLTLWCYCCRNVKDSQAVVDFVHKKIKPAKKTDEGLLKEPEVSLICEQVRQTHCLLHIYCTCRYPRLVHNPLLYLWKCIDVVLDSQFALVLCAL